jgi:hypothetical protein
LSKLYIQNLFRPQIRRQTPIALLAAVAVFATVSTFAVAQTPQSSTSTTVDPTAVAHLELPDAPSSSSSLTSNSEADPDGQASNPGAVSNKIGRKHAPHLQFTIAPNEIADPLTVHEKIVGGLKDSVSLFSMAGWFGAAGWEQATNGSPNYGTNSGAFAARLGAASARGASEGIFSESLFAPIFHQDPRYYIMGNSQNFFKRLVYAGTRVIITRNDSGKEAPNFSLLAGNAAGSALTIPYYPQKNTTFSEVAQTWGGSLGGSAIGYVVDEFLADALVMAHLRKAQQP